MSNDKKSPGASRRVRATKLGFYASNRVKPGTTFTLLRDEDFTPHWMVRVDASTPDDLAARIVPGRSKAVVRAAAEAGAVI